MRTISQRNWEDPAFADPAWFCLRTGPKQEQRVFRQLQTEDGVEAFCPMVEYKKIRASGPVRVREAMFPHYLMARFHLLEQGRRLLGLNGVRGLVEFGGRPALLSPAIVEQLRSLTADGPVIEIPQEIQAGRTAHIWRGPYKGLEVLVTRFLPARDRVAILLEVLGTEREVEIKSDCLLPPADHPLTLRPK